MSGSVFRTFILFVLASVLLPVSVFAQRTTPVDATTDRIIVQWKPHTAGAAQMRSAGDHRIDARQLQRIATHAQVTLAPHRAMSGNAQVVRLSARHSVAQASAIAARLASHPDIAFAVPDLKRFPSATANDAYFVGKLQRNLSEIDVPAAWNLTTGDPALVVAVLDTGILAQHPDLAGRSLPGHDFVTDPYAAGDAGGRDADATDPGDGVSFADVEDPNSPFDSSCLYAGLYESYSSWHGTHIAGIIGAVANNNSGIAGINWNSRILPVRVLGKCGGYDSDIIDGLRWAAGLTVPAVPVNPTPAQVLNLSLGGPGECNAAWQSAIDDVVAAGKVVVAAAGNEGVSFKTVSPASCQGVIAVAAYVHRAIGTVAENYGRPEFSNFGTETDRNLFAAPGMNVYSTSDGGAFQAANDGAFVGEYGTSSAAAHISGVVSLMLSANPALAPADVLLLLQNASTPVGDWASAGRPDALVAVGNAFSYAPSRKPVSLAISGPATVFADQTGNYLATVTWSDSTTSTVYPSWSVASTSPALGVINSAGMLYGAFNADADTAGAISASFTMNGATVTASQAVTVLDNHVISISISGPASVDLNNSAPAIYSARFTYRDGRVETAQGGGATASNWGASAGSISAMGIFSPAAVGPVTLTQTVGAVTASYQVNVIAGAPASAKFNWNCTSEDASDLTPELLSHVDVGSSADIVPLCDGKVLVADNVGRRVDVVDVRVGGVVKSWSFGAHPWRLELAKDSSKVYVAFLNSPQVSVIDLAADQVATLAPVDTSVAFLTNGESGQMLVLSAPGSTHPFTPSVSIYDVASGALLQTQALTSAATSMKYSSSCHILVTVDWSARASYDYSIATQSFTQRDYLFNAGGNPLTTMSPDGRWVLQQSSDHDTLSLTSTKGTFTGAGAGGFSADGKWLLAYRTDVYERDLALYNVATHAMEKTWPKPEACAYGNIQVNRFSSTGAFAYSYMGCGLNGEFGRLFWIPLKVGPTPDTIRFEGRSGAAPGSMAVSNTVTLQGYTGVADVSITGGEYSLDGSAFTASAGTVSAGQTVAVRAHASGQSHATAAAVLTVGLSSAKFLVSTGPALAAQWWSPSICSSEQDLGVRSVAYADIDPAWDMIALCDGLILIGNRVLNRVELFDVRTGAAVKAWQLNSAPMVLRLVPGTSTLLVVTESSYIGRVDLASGEVASLQIGGVPTDLAPGEPGQMMVVSDPLSSSANRLSIHDIASGALLNEATQFPSSGGKTMGLVRYDAAAHTVLTGNPYSSPSQLTRYDYTPATHALRLSQYSLNWGALVTDLVLSGDGTRLFYPDNTPGSASVPELDPLHLDQAKGRWFTGPYSAAGDFSRDGAQLLIGNSAGTASSNLGNGVGLFDTATHALEKNWVLPHCDGPWSKMRRVRFSPTGQYLYALETCGTPAGTSSRLFWLPAKSASTVPKPDPVSFVSQAGVPPGIEVLSNEVKITGLRGLSLPISVTADPPYAGGGYSVNGDRTTAYSGLVQEGDRIRASSTAWFAAGVTTTTTLNIGGTLVPFAVTAGAGGSNTVPDAFGLYLLKRQPLATEVTSNTIVVSGINAPSPISVSGGSYSINNGAYTAQPGKVSAGESVTVRLTTAATEYTLKTATLNIGGVSAVFSTTTLYTGALPPPTIMPMAVLAGWNLLGNSNNAALDVAARFGDPGSVATVWKWLPERSRWAFFAPGLGSAELASYAASRGYDVLSTVDAGEGFWVNATHAFTTALPSAAPVSSSSLAAKLRAGWNLLSVGDSLTPREFGNSVNAGASPDAVPAQGLTALWAWDNAHSGWYFYAPSLDASNSLAAYIASKGYRDFAGRALAPATGFWVNKP